MTVVVAVVTEPDKVPVLLVRLKLAGVATPATAAVTEYVPPWPLAVSVVAVAIPFALVIAVTAAELPNLALAPLEGAVNVTVTPLTGAFVRSLTVACKTVAKGVFTFVLCGVPAVAVMLAATGTVLVKLKLAGVLTPAAVAVTVYDPA